MKAGDFMCNKCGTWHSNGECFCTKDNDYIVINPRKLCDEIDLVINETIKNYDNSYQLGENNSFEELVSMGELVDRLSIINFKLYKLKDEVMLRPNDEKFRSWSSEEDVKLCRERSRLKACIDKKLIAMISRINSGDNTGGFNEEVKKYGNVPGKENK